MAIELDPETTIVLRVKEHQRPEPIPFAEVSAPIQQQLASQRAIEQAQSEGETLLASLQDGKTSTEQAKQAEWQTVEAAIRDQDGLDPKVLQTLFKIPKPQAGAAQFAGVSLGNGEYVLLRLTGINDSPTPLNSEELAQYQEILASRAGQVDFDALMQQLELDAKVERF